MSEFDPSFLGILRCPRSGEALNREGDLLRTESGSFEYPVRDGVCVLLAENDGECRQNED